jgi:hypothetical protein
VFQVFLFDVPGVVVNKCVYTAYLVPICKKTFGEMRSDKSGYTGYEAMHISSLSMSPQFHYINPTKRLATREKIASSCADAMFVEVETK